MKIGLKVKVETQKLVEVELYNKLTLSLVKKPWTLLIITLLLVKLIETKFW